MEPGQSVDYAWDEPGRTRKLRCELDGAHGAALREPATHTYTLDEIKVGPRLPAWSRIPNETTSNDTYASPVRETASFGYIPC